MKRKITFFCLFLLVSSCGKTELPENIVANVGGEEISYGEFLLSYLTMPRFRSNVTEREARLKQLAHLKDRMHLYLAAEKDNLGELPEILEKVDYIRNKETLKLLYEKEIWQQIPVTDDEAWMEYKRQNIEVKLRHLFTPNEQQANEFYEALQNGETFESLAPKVFRDSVLAENGGDLGFVTIQSLDPMLADSVYSARVGVPTKPLQSSHGWHVMRVDDVKQQIFLSKDAFVADKSKYINDVKQRRATVQSNDYVKNALKGKSVTIKSDVLNQLMRVNRTHLQIKNNESPIPTPSLSNEELTKIARDSEGFMDLTLVEFTDGSWTVREFLDQLRRMPPMQRPNIETQEGLTTHIIDMTRDHFLLEVARSKGYDRDEGVNRAVNRWRRSVMADAFQQRLQFVAYKEEDPEKWEERRKLIEKVRTTTPAIVDTLRIFADLTPMELEKRVIATPIVLRQSYRW